jgi:hypothetical protein
MLLLSELLLGILDIVGRSRDFGRLHVTTKDVVTPEVTGLRDAVAHDTAQRDVEDGVQFLERLLLRLGEEEQHEHPARDVPGGVPGERSGVGPGLHKGRPGDGDDGIEEPSEGRNSLVSLREIYNRFNRIVMN